MKHYILMLLTILSISLASCNREERTLYRIQEGDRYGYIDSVGNVVIPSIYKYSSRFTDSGYATIVTNIENKGKDSISISYGVINTYNEVVIDSMSKITISKLNRDWFYAKEQADSLILNFHNGQLGFNTNLFHNLSPNNDRILYQCPNTQYFGYKDMHDKVCIIPIYRTARRFKCGVAVVSDTIKFETFDIYNGTDRTTVIDVNGNKMLSDRYFVIDDFIQNKSIASKSAWINDELVIEDVIINNKGLLLSSPISRVDHIYYIVGQNSRHLMAFKSLGTEYYTFIDDNGKYLSDNDNDGEFDDKELFSDVRMFSEGYCGANVSVNDINGWYFLDTNLDLACATPFDSLTFFSEGHVAVKEKTIGDFQRTKWGYLDTDFKLSIDYLYDECGMFHNGLAYFKKQGRIASIEGYINKRGKTIWQTTTTPRWE